MQSQEKGIYIPVVATLILMLLTFVIGLGIDTAFVKLKSHRLRSYLEDVCKAAAATPTLKSEVLYKFSEGMNYLLRNGFLRDISISDARVIIPTMPLGGNFGFYQPASPFAYGAPYVSGVGGVTFESILGSQSCFLGDGQNYGADCVFQGAVEDGSGYDPQYPSTLWNNLQNSGNTVACWVQASVNTFFSKERRITAKTVWWRPVREKNPPAYNQLTPSVTSAPGLTIAISTHLTTDVHDKRFRFHGTNLALGYSYNDHPPLFDIEADPVTTFKANYNPLYNFSNGAPPGRSAFLNIPGAVHIEPASGEQLKGPYAFGLSSDTISPVLQVDAGNVPQQWNGGQQRHVPAPPPAADPPYGDLAMCPGGTTPADPATQCVLLSDREEMLASCMNPLILVRNTFLASIVELASRHGILRNMSELLNVGTQHRNIAAFDAVPATAAAPVVMAKFGDDLARRMYQIPYVTYHSGGADSIAPPAQLGPHKYGLINPFDSGRSVFPAGQEDIWQTHHWLIASQLRLCYHLYQGSAGELGIERFYGSDMHRDDAPFEDTNYDFSPTLRANSHLPNEPWDQECPWDDPGCTLSRTRDLTAAELVSVLGATQMCPYRAGGLPAPYDPSGVCQKPAARVNPNPANDLRPDWLGLMYYLNHDSADGSITNFSALKSPGSFPVLNPAAPNLAQPYNATHYHLTQNRHSAVLIVLHQPLGPNEIPLIRAEATGSLAERPITVVYFPANWEDAQQQVIDGLINAFDIQPLPTGDITENRLFVFSPLHAKYGPPILIGDDIAKDKRTQPLNTLNNDNKFLAYWLYLLTEDLEGERIDKAAQNIFYERILRLELKL